MHTRQVSAALITCVILTSAWPHPVEAQERWRLSPDPFLVLGTSMGPRHSAFHRVGGAVRMPDGTVVVADLGTMGLRVFSASGDYIRSFGGQGGGPEEFEGLLWVDRCGSDSVAAYDFVRARLTWWTPEGELLRSITPAGPTREFPPYTVTCGPTGRFAAMGWPNVQAYSGAEGPYRMDVDVALLGSDGTTRQFGRATPPLRFTTDLLRTWQDSLVQRVPPANRPAVRRQLSRAVMPDFLPAYSDIRVDATGAVWVARFGAPGETITVWDVFQENGRQVASLEIPLSFRPTEIGAGYVLGVSSDELGVEQVVQYMLIR